MLTIRKTQVFHGPSVWAPVPAIVLEVAIGQLEDVLHTQTPVFFERLVTLVPALRDFSTVVGQPDGGLRRLLLDRLALALQQLAGAEVTVAETYPTAERGVYTVVYQFHHEVVGRAAGDLAVRFLNHLLSQSEPDFAFDHELETTVLRLAKRRAHGLEIGAILAAAEQRGIPVRVLDEKPVLLQLGQGTYLRRFSPMMTSHTASLAVNIARNKDQTNRLLREVGLPVPRDTVVRSVDEAVQAARLIGYPVVLKPLTGHHGRGVSIDLRSEAKVREFFPLAAQQTGSGAVIVQRYVRGRDYRILVINNQVVAVTERVPAHVMGDGTHTVAELVEITNADPRRGVGHEKPLTRITVDAQTIEALTKQGLALDDVPEEGRVVPLKLTANLSTGGTAIDRTDEIHPVNAAIARQAAMVVGLDVAGIDLITPDIARSVREQRGAIVEVNHNPGLRMHIHPTVGASRDVGGAIVDMLFPLGTPSRVPIVAITGTNGKTTTTRMIAHIMKTAGKKVGMTTTDGIAIDGTQIAAGDMAGASSARKVLRNPSIDFAVLETARLSILRDGLAFDHCDVAVVTNVAADHLGLRGIETVTDMARVKAVVPRAVAPDGASVLNGDDPATVEMAAVARGEIIFFSLDQQNPIIGQHVGQGGRAVVLRQTDAGEMLTLLDGEEATAILLAEAIPATMEGRIRVNIQNALAATAAALAQDVPLETIRTALCSFANSVAQTPGRFNLLEIEGRTVVLDYCHNLHGLEAMADFVTRMGAPRSIAAIYMTGDRTDEHIAAFGRLAAQTFDELVIRDALPKYQRGRQPGEVPALLRTAAIASGFAPDKISLTHGLEDAVDMAIANGGSDSLVVLLGESAAIWNHLTQRQPADVTL
jgi:cyanophycin synthetase